MWGCIPSPAIFNNVVDEYTFSMISNLFVSNKSYTLSNHKSKMCKQNESYLVKHIRIRGKTYKICLKIVQTARKWLVQCVNFRKSSGGTCSRTSIKPFLFLNLLQINSAEKVHLKESNSGASSLKKF